MERLGYTRLYATVTGTLLVLIGLFGFLASSEFKTPYLTDDMLGSSPSTAGPTPFASCSACSA